MFPEYDVNNYFVPGTYAFGRSKSLGTITPIDTAENQTLHSNWATNPCERFHVNKLTVAQFFKLLGNLYPTFYFNY